MTAAKTPLKVHSQTHIIVIIILPLPCIKFIVGILWCTKVFNECKTLTELVRKKLFLFHVRDLTIKNTNFTCLQYKDG